MSGEKSDNVGAAPAPPSPAARAAAAPHRDLPIPDLLPDPRRVLISVAMQVAVLAWMAHAFYTSGNARTVGSYLAAWNPWASTCGLLPHREYVLTSDRLVLPYGTYPGYVHVRGGVIADVKAAGQSGSRQALLEALLRQRANLTVVDYGAAAISPGLIDIHVHMNEPGRVEWEGMETATRAAAAGGVTTVVDMPLNSHPCTTTAAELKRKVAAAAGKLSVNAGFWGGLVPANARAPGELRAIVRGGALGFKAFMAPSGIDDFPHVSPADVEAALPTLRALGVPLLVHAELVDGDVPAGGDPRQHATWLASRPRRFEKGAVRALLSALRATNATLTKHGFRVHVVHLADADLLPELAAAKAAGLPLTVETCPHYLNFAAEDVPEGDTRFKCAPPLRERENAGRLLAGLLDGTLDSVASDHSPSEPALKRLDEGDFMAAWGGIAGLQYSLPATWHPLSAAAGANLTRLAALWSAAPARVAGLASSKGRLAVGLDADLAVWAPEELADTSAAALHHRHKVTPYAGAALRGRVLATYVGGAQVYDAVRGVAPTPCGATVLRRWLLGGDGGGA